MRQDVILGVLGFPTGAHNAISKDNLLLALLIGFTCADVKTRMLLLITCTARTKGKTTRSVEDDIRVWLLMRKQRNNMNHSFGLHKKVPSRDAKAVGSD